MVYLTSPLALVVSSIRLLQLAKSIKVDLGDENFDELGEHILDILNITILNGSGFIITNSY